MFLKEYQSENHTIKNPQCGRKRHLAEAACRLVKDNITST